MLQRVLRSSEWSVAFRYLHLHLYCIRNALYRENFLVEVRDIVDKGKVLHGTMPNALAAYEWR
jgi:hypothetical protein